MKKIAILLLMMSFACIHVMSQFKLTPAQLSFSAQGGNLTVEIDGYTGSWLAGTNPNITWLSASPESGTGNGQIVITAAPNTGTDPRSYTIQFFNGKDVLGDLLIAQEGVPASTTYGCKDSTATNYDPTADIHNQNLCKYSTSETYGCKDSTAINFDPTADIHQQNLCEYTQTTYGCKDSTATNYDPVATHHKQDICKYGEPEYVYGCTDPMAQNYNPNATRYQPNSCVYADTTIVFGCTDLKASNYSADATIDNGSCIYDKLVAGCTDSRALNYNSLATMNDGTCRYDTIMWGCTDAKALNYNPQATRNDGYCTYAQEIKGCTDKTATNYAPFATIEDGSCTYAQSAEPVVFGCTNRHALNYNQYANTENNTCIFKTIQEPIEGCTDPDAINYNAVATVEKGNCVYQQTIPEIYGCTDAMALNFNPLANMDDKSCVYSRPLNTYTPPVASVPADTIGTKTVFACQLDNTLPIDRAEIVSMTDLGNGSYRADWLVYQNKVAIPFTSEYTITGQGNMLFYLSILCNTSTAARSSMLRSLTNDLVGYTVGAEFDMDNVSTSIPPVATPVSDIQVYPNPFREVLHVKANEIISAKLYSIEGQLQTVYTNATGIEINGAALPTGMYLLKVTETSGKTQTFKVVKK